MSSDELEIFNQSYENEKRLIESNSFVHGKREGLEFQFEQYHIAEQELLDYI